MGFPRREYWSGLPCPSPGDLPAPGMEPASPALAGGSLPLLVFTVSRPCKRGERIKANVSGGSSGVVVFI